MSKGAQLLDGLEKMIAIAFETFLGGTRCEVAAPVGVRVTGVGEEVLRFVGPSQLHLVQLVDIARGRRIEHIHLGALHLASIHIPEGDTINQCGIVNLQRFNFILLNQFVHVLVVDLGILVLEVITHGHHDVCGTEVLGHILHIADEVIHPGLDVVVVAIAVDNGLIPAQIVETEAGRS